MNKLLQHVTVMDLVSGQPFEEVRKFSNATEDDLVEGIIPEACYLTTQSWEAMGSPNAITIVVYPGDILNTIDEGELDV